jgi:hypothetical protein
MNLSHKSDVHPIVPVLTNEGFFAPLVPGAAHLLTGPVPIP